MLKTFEGLPIYAVTSLTFLPRYCAGSSSALSVEAQPASSDMANIRKILPMIYLPLQKNCFDTIKLNVNRLEPRVRLRLGRD